MFSKMKLPKNQPFWTSVILHLVLLFGLCLLTIVQAFKPKETAHIFEMVDPPGEMSETQVSTPAPQPPVNDREVDLPPVPDVDVSSPKQKEPAIISYEEFSRNNPKPDPRPRVPAPRPRVSEVQIDVPDFTVSPSPRPTTSHPQPLSSAEISALKAYSAQLRSKIDAAWVKPAQLAGIRIVAEVVFEVSAAGRITGVRLRRSSGNAAFDQSVLAAFRNVGSAGSTPTGQAHRFTLPFRMSD
jgi:TonB family protein